MAAPPSITMDNLTGTYVMERKVSDAPDAILAFQGMSWLTRQAISWATITLHVRHTKDSATGADHIDIVQKLTGGFEGTREQRIVDGTVRTHEDHVFGKVHGKSTWVARLADVGSERRDASYLSDEDRAFLVEGWGAEMEGSERVFLGYVEAESGWVAWSVWGFKEVEIEGVSERRWARHHVVVKPATGESKRARMYYDYLGPLEEGEVEKPAQDDGISDV
ncbi:hypothetical protein EJ05DRAFT_155973 [Pseudovirgaria hyperparasitica]|uniref:Uncharacterized protein n=1 Tax=Pseudovirgaria hyperparasitica TaxID=470096 RepID=A0A6A6VWT8_9PEZI|nr:uncharacterized protein EJ05DRAFT_155973 [Pseudovirgaria hyperparasitica]KAF2754319.1 hypothetical protein EJ05DRAFT_155973 [Pseudovirgaria hyperparasitica]